MESESIIEGQFMKSFVYIQEAICTVKIESGCGVFLQLYPYKTKQGEEKLAGKHGMVQIFEKWLKALRSKRNPFHKGFL